MMSSAIIYSGLSSLLILSTLVRFSWSGSYSSATGLIALIKHEQHVVNILKKYEQRMRDKDPEQVLAAQRYIKSFEEFFVNNQTVEEFIQHPINYYHMFKHIINGFAQLTSAYEQQKGVIKGYLQSIHVYRQTNQFPTIKVLETAVGSLARLQYMNQIPVTDLIEGVIRTKDGKVLKSAHRLSSEDCYLIGKSALYHQYTVTTIEFLKAARRLREIEVFGADDGITKQLDAAIDMQNKYGNREEGSIEQSVSAICRGEYDKNTTTVDHTLVCRYVTRNRPRLLIAPLKLEEVSRKPTVMMFHDFLNNWEIERFKSVATPRLGPSKIYTASDVHGELSFHRISEQTWLNDAADPQLTLSVSRRLEDGTGLNTGVEEAGQQSPIAEAYQILNYGIGGLYLTHPDYVQGQDNFENEFWYRISGDRLATMLLYLSDVEVGGATVFPKAGITVWPKRGAAAFWYNLKKSTDPDPFTLHAGCPVVHGTKWISNKWVHVKNQPNYQCSLHRDDLHELLK